ncbi:hypothetical protein [Ruminococcus sp.]|uniref:hypothetical protein n=1 Tax=Ruminococcus sp. TaxID=41978 RepID=UPI0025F7BB42|nr:hypothetical protein [Ruminococcus sp.]
MNRKQWIAVLIGFLSLLADGFAAAVNYLDYRLVYGNTFGTVGSVVLFWAPYLLFGAAVVVLTVVLVILMKSK